LNKRALFTAFLILLCLHANAFGIDNDGHNFSYGVSVGLLQGASEEIVYRNSSSNDYLSLLIWQLDPLFYFGVDFGYHWRPSDSDGSLLAKALSGFYFDAALRYGLPASTGLMEDRDWINHPSWLTHYSFHENRATFAIFAGLDIGKSFTLYNDFGLRAFLSYDLMLFSYAASGGTFLYPQTDEGHFFDPGAGDVVTYKQSWHVFSPGVSLHGPFNSHFALELFFKASPLILSSSYDNHLSRNLLIINESMLYGLFFEPGLVLTWTPGPSFTLSLSLGYKDLSGSRGNSTYRYPAETSTYRNVGGSGFSAFDINLSARFKAF